MNRARLIIFNAALGPLDYRVPDGMDARPGAVVLAPLGPRQITGIVWEPERLPASSVPDAKLRPGPAAKLEIGAGLALCRAAEGDPEEPLTPEQAEDLLLIDGFVRRPPPEVAVLPLDADLIIAHLEQRHLRRAA